MTRTASSLANTARTAPCTGTDDRKEEIMLATMMLLTALGTAPSKPDALSVFIGDSRTVGMEKSVTDQEDELYIGKVSMGYNYLKDTAWPEFLKVVEENDDREINALINFGVNDLANEEKYATFINDEAEKLPENVHVSWVSVNPTKGSYDKLTGKIEKFNEKMKEDLDKEIDFIDSYTFLKEDGFTSYDGLHYDATTNIKIHDFVKDNAEKAQDETAKNKIKVINIHL